MTHELKIHKQWADAKLAGLKPFEIRRNDRGFQKGDTIRYIVVDPKTGERWFDRSADDLEPGESWPVHPLEKLQFLVTYVTEGRDGLEKGYCVFADMPVVADSSKHVSENPVSADLGTGRLPQ